MRLPRHRIGWICCLLWLVTAAHADEAMDPVLASGRAHGAFTSAQFSVASGQAGDAGAALEKAVRAQPTHARAWCQLGDLAARRGELAVAQQHYRRSVELEPEFVFARFNLACVLSRSGDAPGALLELEALLKLGYARWEKLQSDADLAAARVRPEFAALLTRFKAEPVAPSRVTAFHLADRAAKLAMLEAAEASGDNAWKPLATQALLEHDWVLRRTAIQMHRFFDALGSHEAFVRGIYDANENVAKAAATALANLGDSALPFVDALLASGDTETIAYARQIKRLLERDSKAQRFNAQPNLNRARSDAGGEATQPAGPRKTPNVPE